MGFVTDWHLGAAALSGILAVASVFPYVRDILRGGDTKPNAVSWFLWTLFQSIALMAQWQAGASWSIVILAFTTFNTALITVLAVIGYGYREYGWIDGVCLLFALAALVAWQLTGNPVLAILLSIVADLFASFPTLLKTYRDPRSEHVGGWLIITLAAFFGVLSTEIYNTANLAYPIYLLFMNGVIFELAYFGRMSEKT